MVVDVVARRAGEEGVSASGGRAMKEEVVLVHSEWSSGGEDMAVRCTVSVIVMLSSASVQLTWLRSLSSSQRE